MLAEPFMRLHLCRNGAPVWLMMYLLFRRSPSSPAEQHTRTYEEADNSIPAGTEPPAVESWKTLNHHL